MKTGNSFERGGVGLLADTELLLLFEGCGEVLSPSKCRPSKGEANATLPRRAMERLLLSGVALFGASDVL